MDQNDHNKKPSSGKNNGNWRGIIQLVCWALVLTVIVGYARSYMTSTGNSASTVEMVWPGTGSWNGWTSTTARISCC
jgi:cell division protease FtsH